MITILYTIDPRFFVGFQALSIFQTDHSHYPENAKKQEDARLCENTRDRKGKTVNKSN